jgi:glutathione peroxidase
MIKLKFLLLKIKKDFLATKRQKLHGIGEKRIEQFFLLFINTQTKEFLMKKILSVLSLFLFPAVGLGACGDFYDTPLTTLQGDKFNLCEHKDKPIIFVNTASKCGFTSQFEDLERLYSDNKDKLLIVGFPSNDFNQEPGSNEEIQKFCKLTYAVEFPMMEKSSVVGPKANPIYQKLSEVTGKAPMWNFYKFVVMPNFEKVHVFSSMTNPESKDIKKILQPFNIN